jgi:hypothetical protein
LYNYDIAQYCTTRSKEVTYGTWSGGKDSIILNLGTARR